VLGTQGFKRVEEIKDKLLQREDMEIKREAMRKKRALLKQEQKRAETQLVVPSKEISSSAPKIPDKLLPEVIEWSSKSLI
jgi:hypothetical protein